MIYSSTVATQLSFVLSPETTKQQHLVSSESVLQKRVKTVTTQLSFVLSERDNKTTTFCFFRVCNPKESQDCDNPIVFCSFRNNNIFFFPGL